MEDKAGDNRTGTGDARSSVQDVRCIAVSQSCFIEHGIRIDRRDWSISKERDAARRPIRYLVNDKRFPRGSAMCVSKALTRRVKRRVRARSIFNIGNRGDTHRHRQRVTNFSRILPQREVSPLSVVHFIEIRHTLLALL